MSSKLQMSKVSFSKLEFFVIFNFVKILKIFNSIKITEGEKKLLTGSEEGGKESKSEISGYLVGFAKRVVLCTILVFAFK